MSLLVVCLAVPPGSPHDDPTAAWSSVTDLMNEVEGYRAERQSFLIETGTPKRGRYNGAKLNGRSPEAAVETCDAQLARLQRKLDAWCNRQCRLDRQRGSARV
jgi:hypothetical protein